MLELVLITSFHCKDIRRQTFCLDKTQCLTTVVEEMLKYQWKVFLILEAFFHAALYKVPV